MEDLNVTIRRGCFCALCWRVDAVAYCSEKCGCNVYLISDMILCVVHVHVCVFLAIKEWPEDEVGL